ncbi:MAG: RnfABCDGE type electron transport complex subunit G [Bacteroidales bacterium]
MEKLESTIKNMVMSLTFISLVASALLAGAYVLTKNSIQQTLTANKEKAIKNVLPDKTAKVEKPISIKLDNYTDPFVIYAATKKGQIVGAAIETYSDEGYGGKIKIMVGMDKDGTISDYSILESNETPGLGAKANEWFRDKGNIKGKNPSTTKFMVTKDGGQIEAITASTITSRAFLKAVQCAYDAFKEFQNK